MGSINKYILVKRVSNYPCATIDTYGWIYDKWTELVELAPQHRTKPANLLESLTSLNPQYSDVRISRIEHRVTQASRVCNGVQRPSTTEEWISTMPTGDWPPEPYPNWELAMRNKIQSDKISFAENIGEWRESVDMVHSASNVVQKAWRITKKVWRQRGVRRKARAMFRGIFSRDPVNRFELQDVMAAHLAIKFGIVPIIGQTYDVVTALQRVKTLKRRHQVTMGKTTTKGIPGLYGGSYDIRWEKSIRAIAYVTYDWESSDFTAGNIAEAIWAGTKLSFMADWFFNVSSYLSSFNAMNGVTSLQGVLCERQRVIGRDDRLDTTRSSKAVTTSIHRVGTWARRSYKRTTFGSIPLANAPEPGIPTTEIWGRLASAVEIFLSQRRAT